MLASSQCCVVLDRTDTKPVEVKGLFPISYSRLFIKSLSTTLGGRKEGASRMIFSCHCQMHFCGGFE